MDRRRSRPTPGLSFIVEALESRMVLSAMGTAGVLPHGTVEVATQVLEKAATKTTLAVTAGTLGQPITFTVTVRAPAGAGAPTGTVAVADHGTVIQTLTLSPSSLAGAKSGVSKATATLLQPPGGSAYYFGKHTLTATFIPGGAYRQSFASKAFTVSPPSYTTLAGGTKVATITPGTGAAIQPGQTANVLYTGYLAKTGRIFDDSISHGGTPLSFPVGVGQVVPGFDAGVSGMKPGETRIVRIPPAEGYGATANGPIPASSTLVFEVTLASIS